MADTALHIAQVAPAPMRQTRLLLGLGALLIAASALWMFQGLGEGNRAFILHLRAIKLGSLLVVAAAVGVSTLLFQTVAANRVLTPSIMGFDALYVLLQTAMVAGLGVAGFAAIPDVQKFLMELVVMCALAVLLFGTIVIFVASYALCVLQYPNMLSTRVIGNLLTDNAFLGIAAVGMKTSMRSIREVGVTAIVLVVALSGAHTALTGHQAETLDRVEAGARRPVVERAESHVASWVASSLTSVKYDDAPPGPDPASIQAAIMATQRQR